MAKRMTKSELQESLGAFNPVGHAVLAFASDAVATEAHKAIAAAGFVEADILVFESSEFSPEILEMMRNASGAAGFGYEITLMRRYVTLASEGCGWLIVFAPEEDEVKKVAAIAKQFAAKSAVHYGRFASEDLV